MNLYRAVAGGRSGVRGDAGVYDDDVVGGLIPEQLGTGGRLPARLRVISSPTCHSRVALSRQHEHPQPRERHVTAVPEQ